MPDKTIDQSGSRNAGVGGDVHGSVHTGDVIYQAPTPAFNPLHQLPAPPAHFTGRDEELAKLQMMVSHSHAAISGVRGMGGIGKTALALALAARLQCLYPDAQFYLDMLGMSERPLTAAAALAHVIQAWLPTTPLPVEEAELRSLYLSLLHTKRALILLDNVRDAAQVNPLKPPPGCVLILTSRFRFWVEGVQPLDLDALLPERAQELLLTLAPRVAGHADELARLCGYLPLALQLAAGVLQTQDDLSPIEYLQRLRDETQRLAWLDKVAEPEPQRRIEASLGLSYKLLSSTQQERWRALAVFPAPFDPPAAAAVWALGADPAQIKQWDEIDDEAFYRSLEVATARESLSDLRAFSLVEFTAKTGRYWLHDLARVFAAARLRERPNESNVANLRHARYFQQLLGAAGNLYIAGGNQIQEGLALFDTERQHIEAGQAWAAALVSKNLRAALLTADYSSVGNHVRALRHHPLERIAWLTAGSKAAHAIADHKGEGQALGNLGLAYAALGKARKAIEYYEQALKIVRRIEDRHSEGNMLGNLGTAYTALGETRKAIEFQEQYLTIAREYGDQRGESNALGSLGIAYAALDETYKAIEYYEQALAISRKIGDQRGEGNALGSLGIAYAALNETRKAIEFQEQHLAIAREIGDWRGEGSALGNLGSIYAVLGKTHKAIEFQEQHLAIARAIGDRRGEGKAIGNLGIAYAALGETLKAIQHYELALSIDREIDDRRGEGADLGNLGSAYVVLGEIRKAIELYERRLAIACEIGDRRGEGNVLGNFGIAYAALGETRKAIEFYEQALVIDREIGDHRGECTDLWNLSLGLDKLGDRAQAIACAEAALKIFEEIESPHATRVREQLAKWRG